VAEAQAAPASDPGDPEDQVAQEPRAQEHSKPKLKRYAPQLS
jgi:hypothetical protein